MSDWLVIEIRKPDAERDSVLVTFPGGTDWRSGAVYTAMVAKALKDCDENTPIPMICRALYQGLPKGCGMAGFEDMYGYKPRSDEECDNELDMITELESWVPVCKDYRSGKIGATPLVMQNFMDSGSSFQTYEIGESVCLTDVAWWYTESAYQEKIREEYEGYEDDIPELFPYNPDVDREFDPEEMDEFLALAERFPDGAYMSKDGGAVYLFE